MPPSAIFYAMTDNHVRVGVAVAVFREGQVLLGRRIGSHYAKDLRRFHHVLGLGPIRPLPWLYRKVTGVRGVTANGRGNDVIQLVVLSPAPKIRQQFGLDGSCVGVYCLSNLTALGKVK